MDENDFPKITELGHVDASTSTQLSSPPMTKGSQQYTEWIGRLNNPIARVYNETVRRMFYSCIAHLDVSRPFAADNEGCSLISLGHVHV